MQNMDTILIVVVAIAGVSVLLQMTCLLALAVIASKGLKAAKQYAEELRTEVIPAIHNTRDVLQSTRDLIAKLEPRLDAAAGDLAEITRTAREATTTITASADEIANRVRCQAERVDAMTTSALNGVDKIGHFLNETVNLPVRQVSGVLAAARAILSALRSPAPPHQGVRSDPNAKTGQFI
ncbi:MAG TPA: hypothetical protein VG225_11200 [Terracidiphilus sp.]|jgi:methyl-accepting chemotaxis protein|nr:hypothetical protein [Terracidiphilus sp.]